MSRGELSVWLAQLGGIGKARFAPGTVATVLVGVPAAFVFGHLSTAPAVILLAALFVLACRVSGSAEQHAGRVDPQEVVIDELVGFLVTMIGFSPGWKTMVLGLLLFRLMDIFKPWPVNLLNRDEPGGIWIVLDDVGAGCCAHLVLWAVLAVWP